MNGPKNAAQALPAPPSGSDLLSEKLPVRYYGARMVSVLYAIDRRDADEALCSDAVSAVPLPLGQTLLTLSWFHYPDSTIGAYDELAVSILAVQGQHPPRLSLLRAITGHTDVAGFVLHMPVTSELAREGGRALFGFPKTLANIRQTEGSSGICAELSDQRPVLRMIVPIRAGLPVRFSEIATFSMLHGSLVLTRVPLRGGSAQLTSGRGACIELLAPDAPVARTVGRLVGRREPLAILSMRGFAAELGRGRNVAAGMGPGSDSSGRAGSIAG